jgi:hypothetical protein
MPGDIPHAPGQLTGRQAGVKAGFDLIAGRVSRLVIAE